MQIADCSYSSMETAGLTAEHDSSEQLKTALDGLATYCVASKSAGSASSTMAAQK